MASQKRLDRTRLANHDAWRPGGREGRWHGGEQRREEKKKEKEKRRRAKKINPQRKLDASRTASINEPRGHGMEVAHQRHSNQHKTDDIHGQIHGRGEKPVAVGHCPGNSE